MQTQSLIRTLLWAALWVALGPMAYAEDALPSNLITTRQTLFAIPFTIDRTTDPARRPQAVALYVSLDQGATWRFHSRVEPERGRFLFRAGGDGLYWFAIRTIDAQGRIQPDSNPKPGLRVVVDTVPPQLRLEATRGQAGEIIARWQIDEENFDPQSFRLYYRVLPQSDWETVAIERSHTQKNGGRFHGEVAWLPRSASQRIELRAEVADTSKNIAVSHAQLPAISPAPRTESTASATPTDSTRPTIDARRPGPASSGNAQNTPSPSGSTRPDLPPKSSVTTNQSMQVNAANRAGSPDLNPKPFYPSEQGVPGSGSVPRSATTPSPGGGSGVTEAVPAPPPPIPDSPNAPSSRNAGPQLFSPATGDRGPAADPGGQRRDDTISFAPNVATQPGGGPQLGAAAGTVVRPNPVGPNPAGVIGGWRANRGSMPASPAVDPSERPAVGVTTPILPRAPAPKPADGTVTIQIHPPVGSRFEASPTLAGNPRAATFRSTPTPDPRSPAQEATATSGVPARMVASQQFDLEYDVESVGPSGIAQVELWGTRDGGRTWASFGVDADKESPFSVTVPEEGLYGFRFSVRSGAGLGGEPPAAGSPADIWIGVDLSKPKVRIISAEQGTATEADQLTIRWEAEDWALAPRSISIQFAENREGPWSNIAGGLDQSGQYVWKLDARVPERFHLRIEARDEAGNLGIAETHEPVVIDRRQPQIRIRDVRGR